MPLVDYQLMRLCKNGLLDPFDPNLINPASIDVRLGNKLILETEEGWITTNISNHSESTPFWINSGEFLLAETLETFYIPEDVCGEFRLKSSRAREGFDNALAVWLDPGWHGSKLTLELVNNCRYHSLPLYPGLKIGQIILHQCDRPIRSYQETGRYNNDQTVMNSKG